MGLEDVTEKAGFWILGGVGNAMVLLGWIYSKKQGWASLSIWQLIIILIVIWVASAGFSAAD